MTWTLGGNQVGNLGYSYDSDGRVTAKTGSFAQTNLPQSAANNAFNAANEMTGFNGSALSYDLDGNLTGDGTNTYSWDARNHLSAISGGVTASFVYDAFGRRMGKSINSAVTQFVYDGLNAIQELDGANPANVLANLLTGLDVDEFFVRNDSVGPMNFLSETLGSTLALADSTGTIQTQYTYGPFGSVSVSGSSNSDSYQFTGRENDTTGLYAYRARYYSPKIGRFISQDPLGFQGGDVNLYRYGADAPVYKRDPKGTGGVAVGFVFAACSIFNLYETVSLFGQTAQLEEEVIELGKDENELDAKSCPSNVSPDDYDLRRQVVSNDLQNEIDRLAENYAAENSSNVITGLITETECSGVAAIAFLIPEP